ncbi:CD1107 family mobile element protein, partial [Faecalibaculum rodentium]|uniref:CD1107 family mobile element protein n=1 Tax=Faecalibaculum rodentium TaxID=1702221 RepID=UPI0025A19D9D
ADAGTGAETETVTIGTVNVRSDTYLNLRSGSGMEHSVIGHLLRGTEVEVVGESGDWYEVVVPEATGYVYKDYLDVAEQESPAAPPADEGQDAPDTSGFDEDTLMMMLLLMMSMGNTDAAGPPSAALTPDGNLTLVDDYDEAHADGSGKQFITLVTKAGNTFYLIIDRDDEGEQTVHFLNLVDEADLLALMDEDTAAKYTKPEPEVQPPAETQEPEDGDDEDKPDEAKPAAKVDPLPVLVLVLALLGGGGFFAYTKFFKGGGKKEQAKPDPDADYSEDDEDYGLPEDIGLDDEDEDGFDGSDDEPV